MNTQSLTDIIRNAVEHEIEAAVTEIVRTEVEKRLPGIVDAAKNRAVLTVSQASDSFSVECRIFLKPKQADKDPEEYYGAYNFNPGIGKR